MKSNLPMSSTPIDVLATKAQAIRESIISMLAIAQSGHPGGALGMADLYASLYFDFLHHDPEQPLWADRDRVILSNGHTCPVLYATLAEAGYFPKEELATLRRINSRLQGHPHLGSLPGVENTGGPLGQGLSQACGLALGLRLDKKDQKVICLLSDAEHEEGQTWEAYLFGAKYKLNNLIAIIDRNQIQIGGTTDQVMPLEPFRAKLEAFNWSVEEIDGHDFGQIRNALQAASRSKKRPTVIIANTIPGKGVDFMEQKYQWHGKPPTPEQAVDALAQLEKHSL